MALRKLQVTEASGRKWVAEKDVSTNADFEAWKTRLGKIYTGASFSEIGATQKAVTTPREISPAIPKKSAGKITYQTSDGRMVTEGIQGAQTYEQLYQDILKRQGVISIDGQAVNQPTTPAVSQAQTLTPQQEYELKIARQRISVGQGTSEDYKNVEFAKGKTVATPAVPPAQTFDPKQLQGLEAAQARVAAGTANETDIKNLEFAKSKGFTPTAPVSKTGQALTEFKTFLDQRQADREAKTAVSDQAITGEVLPAGQRPTTRVSDIETGLPPTTQPDKVFRYTQQATSELESAYQDLFSQLKADVPEVDEGQIREDVRGRMQSQLDAIEEVFNRLVLGEQQVGAQALGEERALVSRSGMLTSDPGIGRLAGVRGATQAKVADVEAERVAAKEQVFDKMEQRAREEINVQREQSLEERERGVEAASTYISYLENVRKESRADVQTMAKSGIGFDQLDQTAQKELMKQTGWDNFMLEATFDINKPPEQQIDWDKRVVGNTLIWSGIDPATGNMRVIEKDIPAVENLGDYRHILTDDGSLVFYNEADPSQAFVFGAEGQFAKPEQIDPFFKGSDIINFIKTIPEGQTETITDPNTGLEFEITGTKQDNPQTKQFQFEDRFGNVSLFSYNVNPDGSMALASQQNLGQVGKGFKTAGGEEEKKDDWANARQIIANNPKADDIEITNTLKEQTDLSDNDIKSLIEEAVGGVSTLAEFKENIKENVQSLKDAGYDRGEAKDAILAQIEEDGIVVPDSWKKAIDEAAVETFGEKKGFFGKIKDIF